MGPLTYILWDVDPAIVEVFGRELRWYGLLFGMGLYLSIWLSHAMMRHGSLLPAAASLDALFFRVFLGTLLGARLGHVLFYDPTFYLSHPLEILYIHKGGLASHGGVVGVFIAIWAFARRYKIPLAKIFDYASVVLPLAFFFIRMANLANSEIYGHVTTAPHGFVFCQSASKQIRKHLKAEKVSFAYTNRLPETDYVPLKLDIQYAGLMKEKALNDHISKRLPLLLSRRSVSDHMVYPKNAPPPTPYKKAGKTHVEAYAYAKPRHPTQLYEGLGYLLLSASLFAVWWRRRAWFLNAVGTPFAMTLVLGSSIRFLVEFWKVPQESFQHSLLLNVGQILTLPFLVAGVYLLLRLRKH